MRYSIIIKQTALFIVMLAFMILLPSKLFAVSVDGFYGLKFQSSLQDKRSAYMLRHYGSIELKDIYFDGLSFNTYLQAQHDLGGSFNDYNIYYLYLRYTTFESALDITLGRFEQINNAFMTIDGARATYKTDYYFGVTAYAGVPFFKNFEDKERIFRNTGDLAYGAKVFMNGIKNASAYVAYYHELGKITSGFPNTYTQQVSAGGGYVFDLSKYADNTSTALKGDLTYDISTNQIYSAALNSRTIYDIYTLNIYGDIYNVKNFYPADREFILQVLSNGSEMRLGASLGVKILKYLELYGGTKVSRVELLNNQTSVGGMYNLGVMIDMLKDIGVYADAEVYYYAASINQAFGVSASAEWRFMQDFALFVGAEYANINRTRGMMNAFLLEGELKINITHELQLKIFVRGGNNNIYLDNLAYGAMVRYDF